MNDLRVAQDDGIATVHLARGAVNAIDGGMVEELDRTFRALAADDAVRGTVLTGDGPFFSFGFDVPALYDLDRADFTEFLQGFTSLYAALFIFPRPMVAAINGHAAAGGCMLALSADARLMVEGRARIGLNELSFGASVLAGSIDMLSHAVGDAATARVLTSAKLFDGTEACALGLVDQLLPANRLLDAARARAAELSHGHLEAFRALKGLLRNTAAQRMRASEPASIEDFVEIWYSENTRRELRAIDIR